MARRKKISYKIPPLRQLNNTAAMRLGGASWDQQGINNYDQANIAQNQAAAFNQQFRIGSYNSTSGSGGSFDQGAMNAAGVNQNWGANNANTRQDRVTGATINNTDGFQPTSIPGATHWNTGAHQEVLSTNMLVNPIGGSKPQEIIKSGDRKDGGVNTFSSEIDPADKTEFKNEVVNEVMSTVNPTSEEISPQNKLEELYKPS